MNSVLIVDENPSTAGAIQGALAPLDAEVIFAPGAAHAIAVMEGTDVAVAIIDVNITGMDGYELARRIRSWSHRLPIIFITAAAPTETDMNEGYALNAVDFIFAPINPAALRAKVQTFLELNTAITAARDATEARAEFMQLAVHDLRGPLTVLSGYLSMLAGGTIVDLDDHGQRIVSILIDKTRELEARLQDIADMALVEEGMLPVYLAPIDISAAVEGALGRAEARTELLGAEVETDFPVVPVLGRADERLLGRIIDNLLDNAFKYARGAPRIRIQIEAGPPPRVTIEDHGSGVIEDFPGQIFQKHSRGSARHGQRAAGSGLGLYFSRKLAEAQGAELRLEHTEAGQGSTFGLTLKAA